MKPEYRGSGQKIYDFTRPVRKPGNEGFVMYELMGVTICMLTNRRGNKFSYHLELIPQKYWSRDIIAENVVDFYGTNFAQVSNFKSHNPQKSAGTIQKASLEAIN